jgi:hypothetical protein
MKSMGVAIFLAAETALKRRKVATATGQTLASYNLAYSQARGRAAQAPPPMAVVPFISQTIVLPLTLEAHAPV